MAAVHEMADGALVFCGCCPAYLEGYRAGGGREERAALHDGKELRSALLPNLALAMDDVNLFERAG